MTGLYDVLMVDPPWPYSGNMQQRGAVPESHHVEAPYSLMSIPDIGNLLDAQIFSQATRSHVVFLWVTERILTSAEEMMTKRGYRLHTRLIWSKGHGCLIGTVRRTHEFLEWWYRPPLLPVSPRAKGRFDTVITAPAYHNQHSRKPSAAYALVEALYPDAHKLDAFSRAYHVGWDAYGNEIDHFTPLLAGLRQEAHP